LFTYHARDNNELKMTRQMRLFNRLAVAFVLCLLVIAAVCCGCVRSIDYQKMPQAAVGGVADVTGATTLYMGFTGRDLATGYHRGLSDAQTRPMIIEGGVWFLGTLAFLCVCVWVGLTAYRERYYPNKEMEEIPQSPKKRKPGSKAGTSGTKKPTSPISEPGKTKKLGKDRERGGAK
jgi:hypothetical protein